ncbi:MAG: hypothetical protein O3B86_15390, partial [Planctomycetota bacterium]|nr:hypothetical protein [Planctomycetota bacterium]
MHLKHAYRSLATGVGLLLLSGCYAPYGAYPPGAYTPQGGPQMQYQGVPQQTFVMPGDSLGSPSSVGTSPQSTFAPGGNLHAPTPTARGTGGGSENPVPLPRDPDPSAVRPTPAGPQTSQSGRSTGAPQVTLGDPGDLDFQSPIVFTGADDQSSGGVVAASGESTPSTGHDPDYNWFQGRLEYVASDQAWHLTYDDAPAATDTLGG